MKLKFLQHLIAIVLFLYPTDVFGRHDSEYYIPLVMHVRDFYSASAIVLGHSNEYGDIRAMNIIHSWTRIFGRNHTISLNIRFGDLPELSKYYGKIVRPLVVIWLTSEESFLAFQKHTTTFKMSFSAWFVMFLHLPWGKRRYCYEPEGNIFNLAFNSEMMVFCDDDSTMVLREWYSTDENSTDTFDVAVWNPENDSFRVLTELSLYDRRSNLKGMLLRGVTVKNSKFCHIINGRLHGVLGHIFQELVVAMNFTFEVVSEEDTYGSYDYTSKKWSGAIGKIVSNKADIGIADFAMISSRLRDVDFLLPLIFSRNCLYIMQPQVCGVRWFVYLKIFSSSIWFAIIAIIVVSLLILLFIKWIINSHIMPELLCDELFHVWGLFCLQGLEVFPQRLSLRVAYFTVLVTAVVTLAAYSGSLVCFLTTCIHSVPFTTLDGFVKDGTYGLIVMQDSAHYDMFRNSKDPLGMGMIKLMHPYDQLPKTVDEGFNKICSDPKLAFYSSEEVRKAISIYLPCKITVIDAGRVDSLSMILSKNSPYTSLLNYHLQKLQHTGVLNRFKSLTDVQNSDRVIKFKPVEIFSVASLLAILGGGIILAILILIVERFYYVVT